MTQENALYDFEEFGFPFEDYLEESESPGDYPIKEAKETDLSISLSGTFEERLQILKEAIEEIDTEIGIRQELTRNFKQGFKLSRDWLAKNLRQFESWQFGYKPSVDFRRTTLEKELLTLYREARADQQRAFSDIAALKRERRNLLMDYKSLKATEKAITP